MEAAIRGSAYAKSALDIACWDLFGKETGRRVGDLLGGVRQEELSLYTGVGISSLDETRERCAEALAAGFRQVQVKVGTASWRDDVARIEASVEALGDVDRIIVDANGFWPQADAVRVVAAVDQLDIYVEQPCASVAECAQVRRSSRRPFILDEVLTGAREIVEAHRDAALDAVRLEARERGRDHTGASCARRRGRARAAVDGRGLGRRRHRQHGCDPRGVLHRPEISPRRLPAV